MYAIVLMFHDQVRVVKLCDNFDEAVAEAVATACAPFDPENLEELLRKHHRAFGWNKSVHIAEVTS